MPVNIQLVDANFSLGPIAGFFYSCSFSLQSLIQVEADGDVANIFPVRGSTFRTPIKELHYDGTFFWTLEDLPSTLGIVIKRWRLHPFKTFAFPSVTPIEFRWQDELTLIHTPNMRWDADAFAIEHYHRSFDGSKARGSTIIRLNSVANVAPGTVLYLGPSGFGGFIGNEEQITVTSVNSTTRDVTFSKVGGLENSYLSADPIDLHKSIYVFNQHKPGGTQNDQGELVQFSYPAKLELLSDTGGRYANTTAADFDDTTLAWVRAFQILELNITLPNFDLSASQEATLMEDDYTTVIEVFDVISDYDNNQYLKLQRKETTENLGTGAITTATFPNSRYNFQSHPTLSFVNSVSMELFPNRFVRPFPSADKINIRTTVRDQYNFPVFNKTINWSATINALSGAGIPGTFAPAAAVTNVSGVADTVYTPSATPTDLIIDVKADVL
jgi:hypothetical protein